MKKGLFVLIVGALSLALCSVFFSSFVVKPAAAYLQSADMCYSQCAAYKFVWQGDYCYDLFSEQCSMGSGNTIRDTIKFLKSVYDILKSGDNVETVFKAWFVCKPLIENCIAPQLQACRSTCSSDQNYYAPDLSVGHPYGSYDYRGVLYNEKDKTLTFKVVNNGMGYAWDIGAAASWGYTTDRDVPVSGGGQLFAETISELIYAGARNGPPKTAGDYVVDFLIEESNFAKYLQGFKSDADNYDVPAVWYKTIPFTAKEGELTKVIFNVDPNQMIPERCETNNTFILEIDKLPTPPAFQIDIFSHKLVGGEFNNFKIDFEVKNTGEENGEAFAKIYEGDYTGTSSQTPVYSASKIVPGLNKVSLSTYLNVTEFAKTAYCGSSKKYTLVIFDATGKVDYHPFSLPLYSGSINGRVEDLKGKKVVGATITASTGQTATVDEYGWYDLKGITTLGTLMLAATHPEFSQTATKKVTLELKDSNDPCAEGSLTFKNIDFVLKDQDVLFTVTVKNASGSPVTAHLLAANPDWRFAEEVSDHTPLPGMQPGKYVFTLTAPGYKTISQDVNAVPKNQNLEFTLEKLGGRPTDDGLTIHEPQLLWERDLGKEILANIVASKDGKLVVYYTTNNKPDTGKLYFLDSLTGNQRAAVAAPATGGQSQSALDTSYDGNTTALYVHAGIFGQSKGINKLQPFTNQGAGIGNLDSDPQSSTALCEVSPDGFYVYPFRLLNKGLYQYTRSDIEGIENSEDPMTYSAQQGFHFTVGNNIVSGCPEGGGYCVYTISKNVIANLGDINGTAREADSSQDASKIAIVTVDDAFLFTGGSKAWEKEVITRGDALDISVSPGGTYVIYSTVNETEPHRVIKIFTDDNQDKTPAGSQKGGIEDTVLVHANDKGIFYAAMNHRKLKYYQVGSYSTEYQSEETTQETGAETTGDLSRYSGDDFVPAGEVSFATITPGLIYRAEKNVRLKYLNPVGTLSILAGTLFSKEYNHRPVLLKGQLTAEFASPMTVYAIKFDRYDMGLFQSKLSQFIAGTLAEADYFVVQNIHTKFVVKNAEGKVTIAVETGEVKVQGKNVEEQVVGGKQITIDKENTVKKSDYFSPRRNLVLGGLIALIFVGLLVLYVKTRRQSR